MEQPRIVSFNGKGKREKEPLRNSSCKGEQAGIIPNNLGFDLEPAEKQEMKSLSELAMVMYNYCASTEAEVGGFRF